MRRLVLLVCVLVLVDTMLYAALTPLLAHFAHQLELAKGQSGALVAAYGVGVLAGAVPAGHAAIRLEPRRCVLIGLAVVALASIGFAFADGLWTLFGARLLQGAGSSFTWAGAFAWLLAAAPRDRRGELIGTAMAAAVVGALLGPVVGAAAALVGRAVVFCALAGFSAVLATWTIRTPLPTALRSPASASIRRALSSRRLSGGLALMTLASLLFGTLAVLGPLHLAGAGWGAGAIGAVWLASAAVEAAESPLLGRVSDQRGALLPVRLALVVGVAVSLGLATGARPLLYAPLVLAAGASYGALFTPAFSLIADGAEQAGLAQGMAFGLMNAAWAVGAAIAPALAGAIAGVTGDWIPFVLSAGACLAALVVMRGQPHAAGAEPVRGTVT